MDNVLSDFFFMGLEYYGFLEGVCSHFCLTVIPTWASGGRKEISEVRTPIITFLGHFFQDASTEIYADCNTCTSNKSSRPVSYPILVCFPSTKDNCYRDASLLTEKKKVFCAARFTMIKMLSGKKNSY